MLSSFDLDLNIFGGIWFTCCPPKSPSLGALFVSPRQGFRGGLVFKAYGLLYHSILGSRVIKKKREEQTWVVTARGEGVG